MNDTLPDWITEGATVAEYRSRIMSAHVTFTTVTKVTATQVVCATGNRYRRNGNKAYAERPGLRQVGDGRNTLHPPTHPNVLNAVAVDTLSSLRGTVDRLCRDADNSAAGVRATLDQIVEAVAAARAAIDETGR